MEGGAATRLSRLRRFSALIAAGAALQLALPVHAQPPAGGELAVLQERARELRLADAPLWRALLHYRGDVLGPGVTSLADEPGFFLAEDGKRDPQAELDATLAAFFDPAARVRNGEHPQCAFVARFHWLREELGFDPDGFRADCELFEQFRDTIAARGVTLVLAEAFMNNPSSMFGHSLLRIDRAPPGAEQAESDLLAFAVNFAAEIGDDPGYLFAVKGLTGAYPGYFSVLPYYAKVNQYGDFEQRDLWEYRLDLTPEEIARMIRHLYELQQIRFDYWFFDENCSFELLGLIDVARPGLDLRSRFRGWAIPVDTAREVLGEVAPVSTVHYRPSLATRLRASSNALDPDELALATELAEGVAEPADARLAALPEERRAWVLTVAVDRLRAVRRRDDVEEVRARILALLGERSRIPVQGDFAPAPPRPAARPDEGHDTARFRLGTGFRDGDLFLEARVRPAFHELLDPAQGFLPGAAIQLFDVAVRYRPEDQDVDLHELVFVDIQSLAPRDGLFSPISWRFRTALEDRLIPTAPRDELNGSLLWRSQFGLGATRAIGSDALVFGFAEVTTDFSTRLENSYALGLGGSAGVLMGARKPLGLEVRLAYTGFLAGDTRSQITASLRPRLRLGRNDAIELRLDASRDFGRTWGEVGLFWSRFF